MKNNSNQGAIFIFTFMNYVFWFLMANTYFVLMNIPLVLLYLITRIAPSATYIENGLLLFISLISVGPSLVALLDCMGKIIRDKEIKITKAYFKAYKQNFFESIFYWVFELILLFSIYYNALYLSQYTRLHIIIFQVFQLFILTLSFFVFPIMSRFYLGIKLLVKTSIRYYFKRIHITLLMIGLVGITYYISTSVPYLPFFAFGLLGYGIMFLQNKMLMEIEDGFNNIGRNVNEDFKY